MLLALACFLSMFIFEARLIQRSTFPKLKLIFWHLNEILLSLSKSIQYDSKSIQSDIYHLILRSLLRFSKQLFQPKWSRVNSQPKKIELK